MEKLIESVKRLAYRGRFSIYSNQKESIVRTYKPDGSQFKTIAPTLKEALEKMITLLSS